MKKIFFFIFCLYIFLTSCFILPNPEIEVYFPDTSFENCKIEYWIVEYPVGITEEKYTFESKKVTENPLKINIARGVNLPIMAYPVFCFKTDTNATSFTGNYPVSAIYPADASGNELRLDWSNGFACYLIKTCLKNTGIIKGFDTIHFREAIAEKAEELQVNSWYFDDRKILSRLAYGVFRESSIQEAEIKSFSIPVTGGTYYSDNFLQAAVESTNTTGEHFLQISVPKNRKTTFFNPTNGEVIETFFNDNYWIYLNSYTSYSLSGR